MGPQLSDVWTDLQTVEHMAIAYAPKIIGAIILYFIGKWLIVRLASFTALLLEKQHVDPSLRSFLTSSIRVGLIALLLLAIIGLVGIPITGFAAIIAGVAFGVGSALNGSLGNVAGGVVILITRPFSVGDLVEAQQHFGIVETIGIVHTTLLTSQNRTVHLPNGALSTGVITNYTKQANLRIDLTIPVSDGTDVATARQIAVEAMRTHPLVLSDPPPDVKVKQVTNSGITLVLWPRIRIPDYDHQNARQREADYYSVYFGVQELVKTAFQKHGIAMPESSTTVVLAHEGQGSARLTAIG
ncbi:MAG TPA: mechanosensitive ion channel family protein [Nevskiaceae bacterium]|nr:mechanosensitive ion channel family protein [Nevskiaceae bacterium]